MCGARPCADDKPRPPTADAVNAREHGRVDEAVGATVCPVCQPYLPAQRDPVGGTLSRVPDPGGVLCLGLYLYIELNPERAGMVAHPGDYRWSSYRANAQGEACSGLRPHDCYLALGTDKGGRQAAYRELFRYRLDRGLVDEIRAATNGNYALGSPRYEEQVARAVGRRVVRGRPGRPKKQADTPTDDLFRSD
jgi:hypothetical protein